VFDCTQRCDSLEAQYSAYFFNTSGSKDYLRKLKAS
jgi:hypothetical protein